MINGQSPSQRQDISPTLALIGLGLVVGGLLFLDSPTTFLKLFRSFDDFVGLHTEFFGLLLFSAAVNGVWIYSIFARALGLQRQGSRLDVLTGRKKESTFKSWKFIFSSIVGSIAVFLGMEIFGYPGADILVPLAIPYASKVQVLAGLRVNFSVSILVVLLVLARMQFWQGLLKFKRRLPPMPVEKNSIVIGSIGDEDTEESPSWAAMNRRALNGNILISASIGGGKTQGTILPFFDQILSNFSPRPAILAIDPKGTFIPEAIKIIKKHGLSEHVLHMKLGGNVTFNPIYSSEILKNAKFIETAQMIRAAAVNFMGKSFDSPFWEISAFNLIKNSLVLCGAKYCEI